MLLDQDLGLVSIKIKLQLSYFQKTSKISVLTFPEIDVLCAVQQYSFNDLHFKVPVK
jgi:hypothetical protein